MLGEAGWYAGDDGEYEGERTLAGLGKYGLIAPGDPGLPGCGDQAGEYPGDKPVVSLAAAGEKDGPPGVIPLPTPGVHEPYGDIDGVAPDDHGV